MKESLILLITCLIILAVVVVGVMNPMKVDINQGNPDNTIAVSGTGEFKIVPDIAKISFGVNSQNADVKIAQTENKKLMGDVMNVLKALGIEDKDIQTSSYNIYKDYSYDGDTRPETYTVSNTVSVIIRDIDKTGEVIDKVTMAGVNNMYSISFSVDKEDEAYKAALENAIKDARAKADKIASEIGVKIKNVKSLTENSSGYRAYAEESIVKAADSSAPVSPGELTITASVSVVYAY